MLVAPQCFWILKNLFILKRLVHWPLNLTCGSTRTSDVRNKFAKVDRSFFNVWSKFVHVVEKLFLRVILSLWLISTRLINGQNVEPFIRDWASPWDVMFKKWLATQFSFLTEVWTCHHGGHIGGSSWKCLEKCVMHWPPTRSLSHVMRRGCRPGLNSVQPGSTLVNNFSFQEQG